MTESNNSTVENKLISKRARTGAILAGVSLILFLCLAVSIFIGLTVPFLIFISAPVVLLPLEFFILIASGVGLFLSIKSIRSRTDSRALGWSGAIINFIFIILGGLLMLPTVAIAILPQMKLPDDVFSVMIMSPGGDMIAATHGNEVKLLDANSGKLITTLKYNEQQTDLAFSADGSMLASADLFNHMTVWDTRSGKLLHTFSYDNFVDGIYFSADGKKIAVQVRDQNAQIISTSTFETLETLSSAELFKKSGFDIPEYTFDEDDINLEGSVRLSGDSDETLLTFPLKSDGVYRNHSLSPDHKLFAMATQQLGTAFNDAIQLWDTDSGQLIYTIKLIPPANLNDTKFVEFSFSSDGKTLAYLSEPNQIVLVDLKTFKSETLSIPNGDGTNFESFHFSQDGKGLFLLREESISLWDVAGNTLVWEYKPFSYFELIRPFMK